ncbi:MAG TPA: HIT domain-containing protein [Planktothrix sp.]
MDHLWNPWRYKYVTSGEKPPGCVFCHILKGNDDKASYIVLRAQHNFVVLNLYPYTSGHLLIVPYIHESSLAALDDPTTTEMMSLVKRSQRILEGSYKPDGFNIGLNLGSSAGASVAEHVHMHVVPRWNGDSNFVSVIGETRMLPEGLDSSFNRLEKLFQEK